ncbi:hypothetical protein KG090_00080 [Carnobacteriaceae bacterium zg-ZUI240]|nr:hypothetical protein [Carnobacteriaceae bacterium zg-ZUI240]
MNNIKAAMVVVYFGNFPNYFQLFLNSLSKSKVLDLILYTDNTQVYDYPSNVKVIHGSLEKIKSMMIEKIKMEINLSKPYKLCDFKTMYGYIFEERLKEYDYWGYGDLDVIYGDVDGLLYPLFSQGYDKVFDLGHCSFIKNTFENNRLFFKSPVLKDILQSDDIFIFDEQYTNSINNIFIDYGKTLYVNSLAADIDKWGQILKVTSYNHKTRTFEVEHKKSLFVYNSGKLLKIYIEKDKIVSKEYLYIHLQLRKMKINNTNNDFFKIISNQFADLEIDINQIDIRNFNQINLGFWNSQKIILRTKMISNTIKRKLGIIK